MATEWLDADQDTLVRLALLINLEKCGEANATLLSEIRQLEDRFGLSPSARLRLRWEIAPESSAEVRSLPRQRRIRAVDPKAPTGHTGCGH